MAFRATTAVLKRWLPSPDSPTQILLRELHKQQPLTTEQLWKRVNTNKELFPYKLWMKRCLKFLKTSDRIVTKRLDPQNPKSQFAYMLGEKPNIVTPDGKSVIRIELETEAQVAKSI